MQQKTHIGQVKEPMSRLGTKGITARYIQAPHREKIAHRGPWARSKLRQGKCLANK